MNLLRRFVETYGRLPTEVDPDYLEMLRMGKFRILDVPDVTPGQCCNCGSSKNDGRRYIDVGRHVEWYGAVFFCGTCLEELARAMGLFDALHKEVAAAKSELQNMEDLAATGKELHETVVRAFKEFEGFYASIHSAELDHNPDNYTDSDRPQSENESGTNSAEQSTARTKSGTVKPNPSGRPKVLPQLTDLLKDGK